MALTASAASGQVCHAAAHSVGSIALYIPCVAKYIPCFFLTALSSQAGLSTALLLIHITHLFANIDIDFFSLLYIFLPALAIAIFYLVFFFQDADSECEDYINLPHAFCFIPR